jgi:hypothetical protein
MPSGEMRYHKVVQEAIFLLGEKHRHKEVLNITKGGVTICITHGTKPTIKALMFKPDAIFTIKNRQKIVFQVLSSQAEKNREIEADMLRALLSSEVARIVFTTPTIAYAQNIDRLYNIIANK